MANLGVVAFVLLFAAFGVLIVLFGLSSIMGYVRMRRTDPTDVRSIRPEMDVVELTGTARPAGSALTAPLSRGDALAYDYDVRVESGDDSHRVEGDAENVPFVLDDGTGEVLVNPNGARWSLEEQQWKIDDGEEPPASLREYLDENDGDGAASSVLYKRDRYFREERLEPGEDVYVYGPVKSGPHEDAPNTAVDAYVGTDTDEESEATDNNVDMQLTKDLLPGVGDPKGTLSLGGAGESSVFTVADTGEKAAQRRALKSGLGTLTMGLVVLGFAIAVLVFAGL